MQGEEAMSHKSAETLDGRIIDVDDDGPPCYSRTFEDSLSGSTMEEMELGLDSKGARTLSSIMPSQEQGPKDSQQESKSSIWGRGWQFVKYAYSLALLLFSTFLVSAILWTDQTQSPMPGGAAFFLALLLLAWLAVLEGGQGALVGLAPVDAQRYQASHPRAFQVAQLTLTSTGKEQGQQEQQGNNNLERFILGRQFLVVGVVFCINLLASATEDAALFSSTNSSLWNTVVQHGSGVALILITVMVGQLTAQINSATMGLDFINNWAMLATTYASLGIEATGILHCVYWAKLGMRSTNEEEESTSESQADREQPKQTLWRRSLFWIQVLLSTALLGFSLAVTLTAMIEQKTLTKTLPPAMSILVVVLLLCLVGMLEGLQIALFAVVKQLPSLNETTTNHLHSMAATNCALAFGDFGALLIGRQILVTLCMFVIARMTSIQIENDDDANIWGVSDVAQQFFNTGLLGAIITTILASLVWRIIATSFPLAFLSNPAIFVILHVCLLLEKSGICSASWLLARLYQRLTGLQPDEAYLGKEDGPDDLCSVRGNDGDETTVTAASPKNVIVVDDIECGSPLERIENDETERPVSLG